MHLTLEELSLQTVERLNCLPVTTFPLSSAAMLMQDGHVCGNNTQSQQTLIPSPTPALPLDPIPRDELDDIQKNLEDLPSRRLGATVAVRGLTATSPMTSSIESGKLDLNL